MLQTELAPYIALFGSMLLGGTAAAYATEILKLDLFAALAARFPRAVSVLVSLLSVAVSLYTTQASVVIHNVWGVIAMLIGTALVAASVYVRLIKDTALSVKTNVKTVL